MSGALSVSVAATFTVEPLREHLAVSGHAVSAVPYGQLNRHLWSGGDTGDGALVVLLRWEDWLRFSPGTTEGNEGAAAGNADEVAVMAGMLGELCRAVEAFRSASGARTLLVVCPPSARWRARDRELARLDEELARFALESGAFEISWASGWPTALREGEEEDPFSDRMAHIPYADEYFSDLASGIARWLGTAPGTAAATAPGAAADDGGEHDGNQEPGTPGEGPATGGTRTVASACGPLDGRVRAALTAGPDRPPAHTALAPGRVMRHLADRSGPLRAAATAGVLLVDWDDLLRTPPRPDTAHGLAEAARALEPVGAALAEAVRRFRAKAPAPLLIVTTWSTGTGAGAREKEGAGAPIAGLMRTLSDTLAASLHGLEATEVVCVPGLPAGPGTASPSDPERLRAGAALTAAVARGTGRPADARDAAGRTVIDATGRTAREISGLVAEQRRRGGAVVACSPEPGVHGPLRAVWSPAELVLTPEPVERAIAGLPGTDTTGPGAAPVRPRGQGVRPAQPAQPAQKTT
ncbi:hypothetical protein [Streptomyces sp. NPDC001985]|uniref:hypothetical protein n=1 Tax=Streptomyces sp. NPDC001985 TaxID=3154406 RepID=UPI0033306B6C